MLARVALAFLLAATPVEAAFRSTSTVGISGRGITSASVNGTGHLVLTYSDGTTNDAGYVVGPQGQTGAAGQTGVAGAQGQPGQAGRGIQSATVSSGRLILTYTDGTTSDVGAVLGPAGATGVAGRGISSASISSGRLVLTYSDGTTADLGSVIGQAGPTGATGPSNSLAIGTVTTLAPGALATAAITGTAPSQTLNLGVPGSEVIQKTRQLTDTTGYYAWTLPVPYASGVIPICQVVAEGPNPGIVNGTSVIVNAQLEGPPSNTTVKIRVNKSQTSVASLLGLTILSVPTTATASYVHIECRAP